MNIASASLRRAFPFALILAHKKRKGSPGRIPFFSFAPGIDLELVRYSPPASASSQDFIGLLSIEFALTLHFFISCFTHKLHFLLFSFGFRSSLLCRGLVFFRPYNHMPRAGGSKSFLVLAAQHMSLDTSPP
jgi:hypothetical protein